MYLHQKLQSIFLIAFCMGVSVSLKAQSVSEFQSYYSGTTEWNASSGTITITSSGELRLPDAGLKDFIWYVPDEVLKIFIKANVRIDAGFNVNHTITIQGEDRNTSEIFGTYQQAWAKNNGIEGQEWHYCQIQAYEDGNRNMDAVITVDNLTIRNARSYALRSWDRLAHMSRCNVIDDRGGWMNHSDGFSGGHGSTVTDCYFETGDDVIKLYRDITVRNCTIKMVLNSVPFQFGWGTYGNSTALIENTTVIGYSGRDEWEGSTPVFEWHNGSDSKQVTMRNCHIDVPNASLTRKIHRAVIKKGCKVLS